MNYNTNLYPTERYLLQIKNWLPIDFSDWYSVAKAFRQKNLIVFTENDFPIGFLCHEIDGTLVNIKLFQIKRDFRNKGFGKKFVNEVLEEFQKNGILVAELYCAPEDSQFF